MRTRTLLTGLIALCAALGALWLGLRSPGRSEPEVGAADERAESSPPEALHPPVLPAAGRSSPAPGTPAGRAPQPTSTSPAPPPERELVALFLRADLSPARGARVTVAGHEATHRAWSERTGELDEHGALHLALADEWSGAILTVELPEHARLQRYLELAFAQGALDLGVVVLPAGGAIAGVVRGLAAHELWRLSILPREPALPSSVPRGTSAFASLDAEGRFAFEHVPAGPVELLLFHPYLGVALERVLEVREGETTPCELAYAGLEPARALFVRVGIGRAPARGELWLTDERGNALAPDSIAGDVARFVELGPGEYALTLAVAGDEPLVQPGLRRGTRTTIGRPPQPSPLAAEAEARLRAAAEARVLAPAGAEVRVRKD